MKPAIDLFVHSQFIAVLFAVLMGLLAFPLESYAEMIENFEDGILRESPTSGYGWKKTEEAGTFTWAIDDTQGASGTSKSLKITVTEGSPYFWYLNSSDQNTYVNNEPVNRMSFYLKLPKDWMANLASDPEAANNFHVGTYHRDPRIQGSHETHNWHFYYQLKFWSKEGDWIHVVLTPWPQHQRNLSQWNPGVSPTRPLADFFGSLSRLYFTGNPYHTDPGVGFPYTIHFDEFSFYYEDDHVVSEPEYAETRALPGQNVRYPITIYNTHPQESRTFGLVASSMLENATNYWAHDVKIYDDINNDGVCSPLERKVISKTKSISPLGFDRICVVAYLKIGGVQYKPDAKLTTTLIAWQKDPAYVGDAQIVPSYTNFDIPPGTPAATTVLSTYIGKPDPSSVQPPPIQDLAIISATDRSVTLSWSVPQNAYAYDVRYALGESHNFESALPFAGEPLPLPVGTAQRFTTPPVLEPGKRYTFMMKTIPIGISSNSALNPISNIVYGSTVFKPDSTDNTPPVAKISATPLEGESPLTISFDARSSFDPDGSILYKVWDFGDGTIATSDTVTKMFTLVGTHNIRLTVTDNFGGVSFEEIAVTVHPGLEGIIHIPVESTRLLFSGQPQKVYQNEDWIGRIGKYSGRNRLYFRFDLSAIPNGAQILSAKLRLFHQANNGEDGHPVAIFRVKRAVNPLAVSWMYYATRQTWEQPGGLGEEDSEIVPDELILDLQSNLFRYWNVTQAVDYWMKNPDQNHGIIVACRREHEGYSRYAIETESDLSYWPMLEVSYKMP